MKFKRVKSYSGGALGNLANGITALQLCLEKLRATTPIILRAENNSACIELHDDRGGGGGGGTSIYTSYFRVYASPISTGIKVGVKDGAPEPLAEGICGAVKINGEYVEVQHYSKDVDEAGVYHVWLHSSIGVGGAAAEIIIGAANDDSRPAGPAGLAYSNQLLGRVTVGVDEDDAFIITAINQDYLRGGEHSEYLFGDCEALGLEPEE